MKFRLRMILSAMAAFAPLTAALGGEKTISGVVVDAKGRPAPAVQLAVEWTASGKELRLEPRQKIESDAAGRFSGKVPTGECMLAVLALDKDRKTGAVKLVPEADIEKPMTLQLGPLITASAEIVIGEFEKKPGSVAVDVQVPPASPSILKFEIAETKLALRLPVGSYALTVRAADADDAATEMDLDADEPDYDCGKLAVEPKVGKGAEKLAPALVVSDAIGVDKSVKLSDYKGKWVLIEFWGYW